MRLLTDTNRRSLIVRALLVALASLCASAALTAVSAQAFRGHKLSFAFASEGSGPGQLKKPSGIAVNEATGQVYVLDQGNQRVEVFSGAGTFERAFTGADTPSKGFAFPEENEEEGALVSGVAVDNTCAIRKLTEATTPKCREFDPSNGDVYVTDPGHAVVDKFNGEGKYLNQLQKASGGEAFPFETQSHVAEGLNGVAVATDGKVAIYYSLHSVGDVAVFTDNGLNEKGEANTVISTVELEKEWFGGHFVAPLPGVIVNADGDLDLRFRRNATRRTVIELYSSLGKNVGSAFCAEGVDGLGLDPLSNELFVSQAGQVQACGPNGNLAEVFGAGDLTLARGVAVRDEAGGLTSVYVVDAATGEVEVFGPEPPGPPTVEGELYSNVTGDSAMLQAEVNPRGAGTEYSFEYGRCVSLTECASAGYEASAPVPAGFAGSDFEVHDVSDNVQGLPAGAVYHFRVVVRNEKDAAGTVVYGSERVFTTEAAGIAMLPDGREWELVSPPDKHGALIEAINERGVAQAAASGDAMTYVAYAPTEADPEGYSLLTQVVSRRTSSGWSSLDVETPFQVAPGPAITAVDYRFFSEDLSIGALQPLGAFDQGLSGEASEQTSYLRSTYVNGNVNDPCVPSTMGCYRPLVSGCPAEGEECAAAVREHANVPAGTVFGEEGACPQQDQVQCGPEFLDATPDAKHVVLSAKAALGAPATANGLYEWSEGSLKLVSLLPAGEGGGPAPDAALGYTNAIVRHAISNDGSRIVFSEQNATGHLYVRGTVKETGSDATVRLDVVQPGATGSGEARPVFQLASADGSRVFFTEGRRLTEDSGVSEGLPDLYECVIVETEGELACRLSDLTPQRAGQAAGVQGAVLGASEDASYVYLVATGVLAENTNGSGEAAVAGADNLYVLHDTGTGWTTMFIARLSSEDAPDWSRNQPENLEQLTARVSPDGRRVVFMSNRSLTGADNVDAVSGKRDEEVYQYDASEPFSRTNPTCVSCTPTGVRPSGAEYRTLGAGHGGFSLVGGNGGWEPSAWLAANVPGWTPYGGGRSLYQSRYLADTGRVFFNSRDALVPRDVNGTWDVYEYEPPGVGG
ncbi:MAG: hypothetical protein ACRDK4_10720, partial [Solirubrobacteraceae bacterium]